MNFAETYERYGPMVLRRCRRLLRDEAKAVDAMQDTFVQLLRRPPEGEEVHAGLLHRIATNVCLNRLRTERRHPEDRDDALLLALAHHDDLEKRSIARAFLAQIFGSSPALTAEIAVMHLLDGQTHEEVAAAVGMSVSGVRKRLRTLRARLREVEA